MSDDEAFFGDFDSAPAAPEISTSDQAQSNTATIGPSTSNVDIDISLQVHDIMKLSDEEFLERAKSAWATKEPTTLTTSTSKEQDQQTIERLRKVMEPVLASLQPPATL